MKDREFKRFFCEHLEARLPQFRIHRNRIYMPPLDYVLKSIDFETSSFSKWLVHVDSTIQPLFTPSGGCGKLIWQRLLSFDLEKESEPDIARKILSSINKKVLPSFNKYGSSPADIIALCARCKDILPMEALGYAYVLTGKWSEASLTLTRLLPKLQEEAIQLPEAIWYGERIDRVAEMLTLIEKSPSSAVEKLENYRTNALRELGLNK